MIRSAWTIVPLMLAACAPEPERPADPAADPAVPMASAEPNSSDRVGAGTTGGTAERATADRAPVLAIDGEGLRLFNPVNGAARPIAFGSSRASALAALAFRAPPEVARLEECGAGPLDQAAWPDGLRLYFQDGRFVGWALNAGGKGARGKSAITTASGIGPGSTREELEAAYSARIGPSSLGTEFSAGDLAGLLDGPGKSGRITDMWAGASCNFR